MIEINNLEPIKKTKVKIEFFRQSGKWYDTSYIETDLMPDEMEEIIAEAKKSQSFNFLKSMMFTIEAKRDRIWNKRLFKAI